MNSNNWWKTISQLKLYKSSMSQISQITYEIIPNDETINWNHIETQIRNICYPTLIWKNSKLIHVGYNIKKLEISCIFDECLIDIDKIEDLIYSISENDIRTVQITSFNKI